MQTIRYAESNQGPLPSDVNLAKGVFSSSDGVVGLYYQRRRIAYVDDERKLLLKVPDQCDGEWYLSTTEEGSLKWRCLVVDRLFWSYTSSLLILQGAELQFLFKDRFLLLSGSSAKLYDPRPGLHNPIIAEVKEADQNLLMSDVLLTILRDGFGGVLPTEA